MSESKNMEKIRLSSHVRFRAVDDKGVVVHLENGRVIVVSEVGLFIIETLGRQITTMEELADSVTGAFEVDADQARTDVGVFLDELRGEQVIDTVSVLATG